MSFSFDFSFQGSSGEITQDAECVDVTFHSSLNQPLHTERILFHDYPKIFPHAGLYEQLFHEKLHCQSPKELVSFVVKHVKLNTSYPDERLLRILDMGAGNGVVASEIKEQLGAQVGELVGTDILPEAREAAMRDRPGIYDQYIVADLLDEKQQQWFGKSQFDIVITCAALGPGWGDMPVQILLGILKLVHVGGLIGITLNERWLEKEDLSPWGHFIAMLNGRSNEDWKQLRELGRKRYKHRLDVRGKWIWYICLVFEKVEIPVTS